MYGKIKLAIFVIKNIKATDCLCFNIYSLLKYYNNYAMLFFGMLLSYEILPSSGPFHTCFRGGIQA